MIKVCKVVVDIDWIAMKKLGITIYLLMNC